MGTKITPGLRKRGGIWHIEKTLDGRRLYESTGTSDLVEAERYLARHLEEIRKGTVYGIRPERTFGEAGIEYIKAKAYKKSIRKEAERLNQVHTLGSVIFRFTNSTWVCSSRLSPKAERMR